MLFVLTPDFWLLFFPRLPPITYQLPLVSVESRLGAVATRASLRFPSPLIGRVEDWRHAP